MISKQKGLWASRIIMVVVGLFLLADGVVHIMQLPVVVQSFTQLGYAYSPALAVGLGIIEVVCVILYFIPRTSVLGAILLTGYLGGAVATNLRAELPLLSNILFPVYVGIFVWAGLYLRDGRLRELIK